MHKFSAHKDPYENIYVVVRGHKDVILHAPTDQPWLGYANFRQDVYRRNGGGGALEPHELRDCDEIPWIATDPLAPDLTQNPGYKVFPFVAIPLISLGIRSSALKKKQAEKLYTVTILVIDYVDSDLSVPLPAQFFLGSCKVRSGTHKSDSITNR